MENKDVVPEVSPKIDEATPLVQEENEVERTNREGSMTRLASELSELTLEIGDNVTSTTAVETAATPRLETAIQVPSSNSEGEGQSGASDVEQSESETTVDPGETSEPQTEEPQEITESESPPSSDVELRLGNRREGNRLFDRTMWVLLYEIVLVSFPITEGYYAIKYVRSCEGGDKLPLLLVALSLITLLTLCGRILLNVAKKLSRYDEANLFPLLVICAGDFLSGLCFMAELAYFFTIDQELCNKDFYQYVFYANIITIVIIAIAVFFIRRAYNRCYNFCRT